jgi:hypothetical protein
MAGPDGPGKQQVARARKVSGTLGPTPQRPQPRGRWQGAGSGRSPGQTKFSIEHTHQRVPECCPVVCARIRRRAAKRGQGGEPCRSPAGELGHGMTGRGDGVQKPFGASLGLAGGRRQWGDRGGCGTAGWMIGSNLSGTKLTSGGDGQPGWLAPSAGPKEETGFPAGVEGGGRLGVWWGGPQCRRGRDEWTRGRSAEGGYRKGRGMSTRPISFAGEAFSAPKPAVLGMPWAVLDGAAGRKKLVRPRAALTLKKKFHVGNGFFPTRWGSGVETLFSRSLFQKDAGGERGGAFAAAGSPRVPPRGHWQHCHKLRGLIRCSRGGFRCCHHGQKKKKTFGGQDGFVLEGVLGGPER